MAKFQSRDHPELSVPVTVDVQRDYATHHTMHPVLDPHWSAPCPGDCGVTHRYTRGPVTFPTLFEVTRTETGWCEDCDEEVTAPHLGLDLAYEVVDARYCAYCWTPVEPGTTTSVTVPGLTTVTISATYVVDGSMYEVTLYPRADEWHEIVAHRSPQQSAADLIGRRFVEWFEADGMSAAWLNVNIASI